MTNSLPSSEPWSDVTSISGPDFQIDEFLPDLPSLDNLPSESLLISDTLETSESPGVSHETSADTAVASLTRNVVVAHMPGPSRANSPRTPSDADGLRRTRKEVQRKRSNNEAAKKSNNKRKKALALEMKELLALEGKNEELRLKSDRLEEQVTKARSNLVKILTNSVCKNCDEALLNANLLKPSKQHQDDRM